MRIFLVKRITRNKEIWATEAFTMKNWIGKLSDLENSYNTLEKATKKKRIFKKIITWNSPIPGYLQPCFTGQDGYLSSPHGPSPTSIMEMKPSSKYSLNSIRKLLMKSK
jgi:hypothetical protein